MHIFACATCGYARNLPDDEYHPTCPNCVGRAQTQLGSTTRDPDYDCLVTIYRGQRKVWRKGFTPTAGTLLGWRREIDEAQP